MEYSSNNLFLDEQNPNFSWGNCKGKQMTTELTSTWARKARTNLKQAYILNKEFKIKVFDNIFARGRHYNLKVADNYSV